MQKFVHEPKMDEVQEGFLCPMCMQDLGSQLLLQSHFAEAHSGQDDDASKATNIKEMFGKAKRRILGRMEEGSTTDYYEPGAENFASQVTDTVSHHVSNFSYWEPQDLGYCRDRTREFRSLRGQTNDSVMIEVNTILIRLEKILKSSSADVHKDSPYSRKAIERSLVPWMSDSEAKMCHSCRKSFTVARRKHHCRLCGKVICGKCSQFVSLPFADMLCSLDGLQNFNFDPNAVDVELDEQDSLRTCSRCDGLLIRHYESWKEKKKKVPIVKIYERLTTLMSEADLLLPDFNKMAESLSLGDTRYLYQEVLEARLKLLKIYETLELLSKKVISLGRQSNKDGDDGTPKIHVQTEKLHRGVYAFITNYLQSNMFTLRSLPSEQEYTQLQAERSALLRRRAERERSQQEKAMKERAVLHQEVLRKARDSKEGSPYLTRKAAVTVQTSSPRNAKRDALYEQICNVESYLGKAREKGDLTEISALESNLRELQIEHNRITNI